MSRSLQLSSSHRSRALAQTPSTNLGYTDTPMLPGLPYHVHDPARPRSGRPSRRRAAWRRAIGRDRALRRHGPVAVDADEAGLEGRERLHRSRSEQRRSEDEGESSATCSSTSSGRRRRRSAATARTAATAASSCRGATRCRCSTRSTTSTYRRRPGRRDLRTVAAAGESRRASPASGRPTTSSSRRRASKARKLVEARVSDGVPERRAAAQPQGADGPDRAPRAGELRAAAGRGLRSSCRITSSPVRYRNIWIRRLRGYDGDDNHEAATSAQGSSQVIFAAFRPMRLRHLRGLTVLTSSANCPTVT